MVEATICAPPTLIANWLHISQTIVVQGYWSQIIALLLNIHSHVHWKVLLLHILGCLAGGAGENIAIAGDSAGGGLSIATAILLRDTGDLPPASIACISPWTDLALTGDSIKTNSKVDPMLNVESLKAKANNYAGNADLSGLSPLLIHVGSDELLFQGSVRIAKKSENAGVSVSLKIYDHLWHVFHLNAKLMPESKSALADFGSFITEHFGN